jgi:energy-converting hydrogenase Eha subunit B
MLNFFIILFCCSFAPGKPGVNQSKRIIADLKGFENIVGGFYFFVNACCMPERSIFRSVLREKGHFFVMHYEQIGFYTLDYPLFSLLFSAIPRALR